MFDAYLYKICYYYTEFYLFSIVYRKIRFNESLQKDFRYCLFILLYIDTNLHNNCNKSNRRKSISAIQF